MEAGEPVSDYPSVSWPLVGESAWPPQAGEPLKRREIKPIAHLAFAALKGSRYIWLDTAIEAVPAVRLGHPDERCYEIMGIAPEQQFPSREIRLRGPLGLSYAAGEPVSAVEDW